MSLRDEVHRLIDELDAHQLTLLHQRMKHLKLTTTVAKTDSPAVNREDVLNSPKRVPSIEEVWELTSADKSSWSDAVIADREDRL